MWFGRGALRAIRRQQGGYDYGIASDSRTPEQSDEDGAYRNWLVLLDDLEAVSVVRLTELVHSPAVPTGASLRRLDRRASRIRLWT